MKTKYLILIAVLTGVVALTGCLGGSSAAGPPVGGTELEGTWYYHESDYHLTFTFADSNWTVLEEYWIKQDTTLTWNGTFDISTTTVPKNIDLLCTGSPYPGDVGLTSLGIYALNSTATACTLAINDFGDTVRPTTFGADPLIVTKQ